MYPLTIGLAIENRELMEQTQAGLAELPFRIIVEHQDTRNMSAFYERLERMRPDVVLVDISTLPESLEGMVGHIRGATGDPMIIALNNHAEAEAILATMRAGVNEYLSPPLQENLRRALEKRSVERSRRRDGSAKNLARRSALCRQKADVAPPPWLATWRRNWGGRTRRCYWRTWISMPA